MAQVKPVNKKKMTKSALVATVISVVILVSFVVAILASTGLFVRMQSGASTENFKINGSMIHYFAQSAFTNWYENDYYQMLVDMYGDYASLFYQYGVGPYNLSISASDQIYDQATGKTFADLFVEVANDHVTRLLNLCEKAREDSNVNYAEIEAEAKENAKNTLDSLEASLSNSGYTLDTYVSSYINKNMNASDLEKCLIIENVASIYATKAYDKIYEDLTSKEKLDYFEKNIGAFFTAEYLGYTVSSPNTVEFPVAEDYEGGEESKAYKAAKEAAGDSEEKAPKAEDYVGGENSNAYKAAYEEAVAAKAENDKQAAIDKALIAELEKATSAEQFKRIILTHKFDEVFESAYDSIASKLKDSKPSDSELETYKNNIKNLVIEAVLGGKSNIDVELVLGENATEWEKQKSTLPATIITKLNSTLSGVEQTASFAVTSNLGQKLFGGVKAEYGVPYKSYEVQGTNAKVGDVWSEDTLVSNKNSIVKAIEIYKDRLNDPEYDKEEMEAAIESLETSLKDAEDEIANVSKTGHYTYTAFFVTEAAHREEAKVRDVGHILFSVDSSITTNTSNTFKTSDEAKAAIDALYEEHKGKAVDGVVT